MRRLQFAFFITIAISIYCLLNYYVLLKTWQAIPVDSPYRIPLTVLVTFFGSAFPVGRFLERVTLSWASASLVWIGSYWLAALIYFIMAGLAIDTLRLANHVVPFFPASIVNHPQQAAGVTFLVVVGIVATAILGGHVNARRPRVKVLDLVIPKNSHQLKSLNVVAVSDIHLGTIICKSRLEKIVDRMNELDPDLVLLPGDVVDEDLGPVIKQNLGETLRKIRSRYGVVAITGNHEYIGGVEEAYRYLIDHGINVLRDRSIKIADTLIIVGREDRSMRQFTGKRRMALEELMGGVDKRLPIILMDHQPFGLDEAVRHGVDIQLSGHTHHGQIWPLNYITQRVFELSWGYLKKENTHFYVSCGVGTWGPPVRIGNTPEIVQLNLRFGENGGRA